MSNGSAGADESGSEWREMRGCGLYPGVANGPGRNTRDPGWLLDTLGPGLGGGAECGLTTIAL